MKGLAIGAFGLGIVGYGGGGLTLSLVRTGEVRAERSVLRDRVTTDLGPKSE